MKRILIALVCLMGGMPITAQTMKQLFIAMPDSVSIVMNKMNREDCVDFLANKMKARVQNRFDKPAELLTLTDDYLLANPTANATWEMRRLPVSDSTFVVCMVTTVAGPLKDSRIRFYSTDWKELPLSRFVTNIPTADDFYLIPTDSSKADTLRTLRQQALITFLEARLSPQDNSLSFYYNTPEHMTPEDAARIKAYLRKKPVRYEWKEGKYVHIKD